MELSFRCQEKYGSLQKANHNRRKIKKSYYNSAAHERPIKSAQKNHEKRMKPWSFLVILKFNNRLQYGVGVYIQGRSNSNLGSVRLMVS